MLHSKNRVSLLDQCIRASLYFYVFSFPFSIAGGNLFIDIALILAGVRLFLQSSDLLFERKLFGLIAAYSALLIFSAFGAETPNSGLRQAFMAVYYAFPPFLLAHLFIAPQKRFYYLGLMTFAVLFSAMYAYVQALQGAVRASGFIAPLELAGNVSLLLPVSVLLACESPSPKNNPRIQALAILFFLLFAIALILSGTRGAWLAVGFTLLMYWGHLVATSQKRVLTLAFFFSLIGVIVFGVSFMPAAQKRIASLTNPNDYSVITRFSMWDSASRMWADHPLFGVGLSNYQRFYKTHYYDPIPWERFGKNHDGLTHKHPHNIYLYLLAEMGIIGFCSFMLLIGHVLRHFYSVWKTGTPASQFFAKMAVLVLIAYLSFGVTENLIFGMYPTVQSLWFLLGLLWNRYDKRESQNNNLFQQHMEENCMDKRPTTTCIINNFNYGNLLSHAVQSCLNQTCPINEIIIVDDGSTDNSVALIQQHFGTIPTIQLICKPNAGQLSCLDIGFQASKGEIVFFLDSDDTFDDHYIEEAVTFYQQNTSCDFLFCGMQEVGQKTDVRRFELGDSDYGITALLTSCLRIWIGAPTSALSAKRTSLSKIFPTDPSFWQDWRTRADDFLIYELSMAGARKFYMDKVLVNYHIHGQNLSQKQKIEEQNGVLAAKINRLFEYCTTKYLLPDIPVQKLHLEFALHSSPNYTLLRYYLRAVRKSSLSLTQKLSSIVQLLTHFFATKLISATR